MDKGKIHGGKGGSGSSKTFGEIADLWLKSSVSVYANSTWKIYDYDYHYFIEPIFGDRKIRQIDASHIIKYRTICESEKKYSPETINKLLNIIVNIFDFAVELKDLEVSPLIGIKKLRCKVPVVKHTTWTEDQITYYLQLPFVRESPYYAMLITLFAVGSRPGEICGLAESDLTPQRILTLNRGLDRYGEVSELKNERSHRPLKLSPELYSIIQAQLKRKRKEELKGRVRGEILEEDRNDFLFVGLNGYPVKPDTLSKSFKRLLRKNNDMCNEIIERDGKLPEKLQLLPDMSLYDARHSFATNLMIEGKKSKVIAEVMGNSVKTMEHHYSHIKETIHDEVLEDYGSKVIPIKKLS